MCSCTTSVPVVCSRQFRFHFYRILFASFIVLAGLLSPARSQEETTTGLTGFASGSTSHLQTKVLEGSLSKSTNEGGRFEFLGALGGDPGPIALKEGYVYAGIGKTIAVLDVSDPTAMVCVKHISRPRIISAITTSQNLLVVSDEGGDICVYDLVTPATPVWLNGDHPLTLSEEGSSVSLFIQDNFLYAYCGYNLYVIDLSDPTFPKLTGSCVVSISDRKPGLVCQDLWVEDDYAYLVTRTQGYLVVIDLHTKSTPLVVATLEFSSSDRLYSVLVQGDVLYGFGRGFCDGCYLYCIDISNPLSPKVLGSVSVKGYPIGRNMVLKGNRVYIFGNCLELVDVSDPAEPLKYDIASYFPGSSFCQSAFDGKNLFISPGSPGGIVSIDWSHPGSPKKIGIYREPFQIEDLSIDSDTLYMGKNKASLVDVSEPGEPEVLYQFASSQDLKPLGDGLMLGTTEGTSYIYDVSTPVSPSELSIFSGDLCGEVIYESPYLYGVSLTRGLMVVDLTNPKRAMVRFRGSTDVSDSWAPGVGKNGDYLYVHRNSSIESLRIYRLDDPIKPVQAGYIPTHMTCSELKWAGKNLFLAGAVESSSSRVLKSFDLSDPGNPRLSSAIQLDSDPSAFEIISGLLYIGTSASTFHVFDISSPENPQELLTEGEGPGAGVVDDILASGSRLYVAEEGVLSIYHHILPATPTEVTFTCAGMIHQDTRELHFKIFAGDPTEYSCGSATVISATPLVDCRLGCPYITNDGTVPCDETPFNLSATVACEQTISTWIDAVVAAIDDQAADMLRVTRTGEFSFTLESIDPFYGTLCGAELGFSCESQENRVLNDCPVNNLMDGVNGNESATEAGGFGIVWAKYTETHEPTPTPTATSSDTPVPTVTFTKTITETALPTNTRTPYPTATRTDIFIDSSESKFEKISVLEGGIRAVATDGRYAYVAYGRHLTVLDAEDPANPKFVKQLFQEQFISAALVSGNLLVVGDERGYLFIYSLNNPADPVLLNKDRMFRLGGNSNTITSLFMQGDTLYVTGASDALSVVDLSNPMVPSETGRYHLQDSDGNFVGADDVWIKGDTAFLAVRTNKLKILNLSAQSDPRWIGEETGFSSAPCGVSGSGTVVYVIDGKNLYCIDAANPRKTQILGTTSCDGQYLELIGEGKVITWTPTSITQIFDVSDPLHPTGLEVDSLPDEAGLFAYNGTLACFSTAQQVQFFNWSDPSHSTALSSYSEDLVSNISGVCTKDSLLFAWGIVSPSSTHSLWIIDIANPSIPRVLSEIQNLAEIDSVVLTDDSHLIISNGGRPTLYDVTDLTHPVAISMITNVHLEGDMAYWDKYLVGTSAPAGLGFQVVDYTDPVHPVLACKSNPYQETYWSRGVAGKGGFAFASIFGPKNELLVYNVTGPSTPALVCTLPFSPTHFSATEIELKGNTLFLEGGNTSEYLVAFDVSDPLDPKLKLSYRLPVAQYGQGFAVSAGIAYTCPGTGRGLWAIDISDPAEARLLNKTAAPDAIQVDTIGPYIITAEGSYGIAIYRHSFTKPSTEVTFTCAGLIHPDTRELHFKIYGGEPSENGCGSSTFISAKPLVDCRLGCTNLTSKGTVSCVSQTTDCEQVISTWIDTVIAAIDDQAGDILRVTRTGNKSFSLESIQPFYGALYGDELGLPGQENRVLYDCPIHNLMDGVDGNESATEAGGFGIVWAKHTETDEATPTPTETPSDTPIPAPSFTETATETALPTDTETPIPTPSSSETATETTLPTDTETPLPTPSSSETATETPMPTGTGMETPTPTSTFNPDIIPDGQVDAKDLLELMLGFGPETTQDRMGVLFTFSTAWKP